MKGAGIDCGRQETKFKNIVAEEEKQCLLSSALFFCV